MKAFFFGLLVGLLIAMGGYIVWDSREGEKPDPVIEYVENIHKLDSLQYRIDELTARFDSSRIANERKDVVIVKQRRDITRAKTYADSLESIFFSDRSLEVCDSVIMAKNTVIEAQDTLIISLEAKSVEYSKQVCLLSETINTKDQIIFEKDSTIETLRCAYDWKIKRKFWAWVLGWKCNKDPN